MRSVNKVILIGNLTRDPELRQTPNGQQVCTFGIATNRQWMARDGAKHSSAEFHELVAWARLAEICGQYLKKGKLIYVEGYLKTRVWDTPEGIRRHKTEVIVQDMIMLEKRPSDDEGDYVPDADEFNGGGGEPAPSPASKSAAPVSAPASGKDDDGIEF
ncbi:MAG: single-stranded DNA-binding protein [bacterium]|nr:single-stranded DNA-binding protein [bacterium]